MAPRERSEILRRTYDINIARQDELALVMTTEMAKPLAEATKSCFSAVHLHRGLAAVRRFLPELIDLIWD